MYMKIRYSNFEHIIVIIIITLKAETNRKLRLLFSVLSYFSFIFET